MTTRRRDAVARAGLAVCLALGVSVPARAGAQDSTRARPAAQSQRIAWAHVTYLSGGSVYIDAGTLSGLHEGSRLEVMRDTVSVADLVVAYVASNRAACTVARATAPVVVGDSARFILATRAVAGTGSVLNESTADGRRTTARAARPLHGRLGIRYMTLDPGVASGVMRQPALDLRLDGQRLGGMPMGVTVDARAHRTRFVADSLGARNAAETRVYQAALLLQSAGVPAHLTVGRQFSTALSSIGIFDGVAADFDWKHWSTGLFAGTQPDPSDFGLASAIREYGGYAQLHGAANGGTVWNLTSGAIGSYAGREINREFLYLQGLLVTRRLSVFATQEIDYNRGWKTDAGEATTSPTSTYASARLTIVDWLSLDGGVDNRRNVRLYRDWLSPEQEFDDSFRRGIWGGASLSFTNHVQLGVDQRTNDGGPTGSTTSNTASVALLRLTPLQLGLRARETRYTGGVAAGTLQSGAFEFTLFSTLRLSVNGGLRDETRTDSVTPPGQLKWFGADADVGIGRSLFVFVSTYRETRASERLTQSYAAISWRF
jgi:hypothetical protein